MVDKRGDVAGHANKGDEGAGKASLSRQEQALAALNLVNEQKKVVVKRLQVPWWQSPLIGFFMAVLVVNHAAPRPFDILLVVFSCVGLALMLRFYMNQALWVSGWRKGKTRPLSFAFFGVYLLHYFGSMWLIKGGHQWVVPVAAISMFCTVQIYGWLWMKIWRKEMEANDVG